MKIMKIIEINAIIRNEYENHIIPIENHKNHENDKIANDNNENHEKIHSRITKIMKFIIPCKNYENH